jgi:tRNA (guanine37-N1)-methyltransferase
MPKTAPCIRVPKQQGEKALAVASKLIDKSLGIQHGADSLCIPLIRQPEENEWITLKSHLAEAQLTTAIFTEKKTTTETLTQALQDKLPPHLLASLPQAFDTIGDIVIVEIPPELQPHEKLIGEAILNTHKNIKTVLAKAGAVGGTYRTRQFNLIAGEDKTRTVHREFGCQYHVDVAKAYFSPRLSHEHERVASLLQNGETVVDLFAGVGPFSVLMAKKNPTAKVYAVDLNPDAVELLRLNVRVNRVENHVYAMLGDARLLAATKLKGTADRVIMNLPETAIEFIDAACQAVKVQGGAIHFYAFIRSPDSTENLKQRFSEAVEKNGRRVESFLYARGIRETAPYESQVALDAKIA